MALPKVVVSGAEGWGGGGALSAGNDLSSELRSRGRGEIITFPAGCIPSATRDRSVLACARARGARDARINREDTISEYAGAGRLRSSSGVLFTE